MNPMIRRCIITDGGALDISAPLLSGRAYGSISICTSTSRGTKVRPTTQIAQTRAADV
jgi:hypothetical protein